MRERAMRAGAASYDAALPPVVGPGEQRPGRCSALGALGRCARAKSAARRSRASQRPAASTAKPAAAGGIRGGGAGRGQVSPVASARS